MDFRQIEAFVYVYRLRNFSRAGDAAEMNSTEAIKHAVREGLGVSID